MVVSMKYFMSASDISEELEISRSTAYKIIRQLNGELKEQGYLVIPGRIPKSYFSSRYYLFTDKK